MIPLWSNVLEPSRFIVTLPVTSSVDVKVGRRVMVPDGSVNLCRLRFGTSSMVISTEGFLRKALNYVCDMAIKGKYEINNLPFMVKRFPIYK